MHQSRRVNLARNLLVAVVALAGCRDGTEQQRELEIQVSPDTLRFDPEVQGVRIGYSVRSSAAAELWDPLGPGIQAELSPGSWTTWPDPSEGYVQPCPCGLALLPGYSTQRVAIQPLSPGRYRLRATYRRSDPTAVTAPAPTLEAFSNDFVVMP